jgi:hypothetical protein
MRTLESIDKCENNGCLNNADRIVYSRDKDEVVACCTDCAEDVIEEGCPEYRDICPNCQCHMPVN